MAIFYRQTNECAELLEFPDENLDASIVNTAAAEKELIDLYKMEYERCALRYDDLYQLLLYCLDCRRDSHFWKRRLYDRTLDLFGDSSLIVLVDSDL
ncbi:MAG: hypothetical protein ACRD8U_19950 [Pyrinomonadaceae bacterium]